MIDVSVHCTPPWSNGRDTPPDPSTADSEAGKLLEYLGQAREEIARLHGENKRVVEDSNEKLQEMEERMNAQRGISGVPYFIINNKYGISGAQPAEVLQKALLEIAREPIESKTINN